MGDVVQFKRPKPSELHKGNTLCRSGFHKWEVLMEKQFDVKQGKLITVYRCKRYCDHTFNLTHHSTGPARKAARLSRPK